MNIDFIVIANAKESRDRFNELYGNSEPLPPMTDEEWAELEEFANCL
jgi:hypothetical protein